jgi:hypothetical protein
VVVGGLDLETGELEIVVKVEVEPESQVLRESLLDSIVK